MEKTIRIQFGEEFKAINHAKENDVFTKQYEIAEMYLEEIFAANNNLNVLKEFGNCVNNIIAFTGERGQGKTSAMMAFVNSIKSDARFAQLDIIDPSTFENMHNVVEVIVTKMYNEIFKRNPNDTVRGNEYYEISGSFQKVYESLSLVRNPNKFDDLEQDYEGTIQKIVRAGDSAQLKQHMFELVEEYLDITKNSSLEKTRPNFLMIQIDDIDINISLVYKMTEQIRKYLMIPNVIIIMAVKIEQLKFCIELQFRKEMSELNNRFNQQEPVTMAAKYVEKLIPDGRKIALPELRLMAGDDQQNAKEKTKIEYLKDNNNLLSRYQGHGLESTILGYIYEKIGLHFIKRTGRVHPIVPNTLRELVNLMSVLGKLEASDRLNNLIAFENYFLNTWIPNNLDEGYAIVLRRIHATDYLSMNKIVGAILLDKLDKNKLFTLDTRFADNKIAKFNEIKKYFREMKNDEVSLGDTQELIRFFEEYYTDEEPKLFAFALQTLYSITMNKLAIISPESLYEFIRGSIWGHAISLSSTSYRYSYAPKIRDCIQTVGTSRLSRTYFDYNSQDVIFSQDTPENENEKYLSINAINKINNNELADMLFFSDFKPVFIRRNWMYDSKPMFNLENLFISSVYPLCIQKKISENMLEEISIEKRDYTNYLNLDCITQITTNVELSSFVLEYISRNASQLHEKEKQESDHIERLLSNVDVALRIEAEARVGQALSIFKDDNGKTWLLDTYTRYWKVRSSATISETTDFLAWLKENKLKRICKISSFDYRYGIITEFLNKNKLKLDILRFDEIRNELDKLYIEDQEKGDKISFDTRQKYNQLCDELINTLESSLSKEE